MAVHAQQLPVAGVGRVVVVIVVAVVDGQFAHVGARELAGAAPADPGVDLQRLLPVAAFAFLGGAAGVGDDAVELAGVACAHASAARRAKRFDHRPEIFGRFALERHALARSGMHEYEYARVEHRARRFDLWARVIADIHAFPDQGMAELGQVDADLVLPPGFQAALDQGRTRGRGDGPDVRARALRLGRNSASGTPEVPVGAADSVAAIRDQMGFDALRGDLAVRDRVIDALDVVRAELHRQNALRVRGAREHDQAARVLVEAVHHAEPAAGAASAHSPQQGSRAVDEGVLVTRLVGDAQHSGGLVDDDDVAVEVRDRALGQGADAELGRAFVDDHHCAGRNAQGRVQAALAIHRHPPFAAQVARARPRGARLPAHDRREGGRSGPQELVERFDLDDRRAVVAADPERARALRIVEIDAADVGRARQHVFGVLAARDVEARHTVGQHGARPRLAVLAGDRVIGRAPRRRHLPLRDALGPGIEHADGVALVFGEPQPALVIDAAAPRAGRAP